MARREIAELIHRLTETDAALQALLEDEVDAVYDLLHGTPILLRRAQQALVKSEESFRAIFEHSVDGIVLLDPANERVVAANPAMTALLQLASESAAGMELTEVFPWDMGALRERFGPERADETVILAACRASDGRRIPVEISLSHLHPGGVPRVMLLVRDITEREKSERVRERLVAILEATSDYVGFTSIDGEQQYLNAAGRAMVGIRPGNPIAGIQVDTLCPPPAAEKIKHIAIPYAVKHGVWQGESVLLGANGTEIPVSQVIIAHRTPDGTLQSFSMIARDISEAKRYEDRLRYLAHNDPLTGLYNRAGFVERFDATISVAKTRGPTAEWAIYSVDIDHFRSITNSLGYSGGEDALQIVAGRLQSASPRGSLIGRLEQDRFAVGVPVGQTGGVDELGRRLWEAVSKTPVVVAGRPLSVTVSVGVALYPEHGDRAATLLGNAGLAVSYVKEGGKNGLEVYLPGSEWSELLLSRVYWEERIRNALKCNRFRAYSQPIVGKPRPVRELVQFT